MIEGLSHITLITSDLARMSAIVEQVFDGREVYSSGGEGHSLYFYDHDNHLFELHTGTLEERLERYGQGIKA